MAKLESQFARLSNIGSVYHEMSVAIMSSSLSGLHEYTPTVAAASNMSKNVTPRNSATTIRFEKIIRQAYGKNKNKRITNSFDKWLTASSSSPLQAMTRGRSNSIRSYSCYQTGRKARHRPSPRRSTPRWTLIVDQRRNNRAPGNKLSRGSV